MPSSELSPVLHPIPPVFNSDSRILILGSFPSVRSRQELFFYGHPRNRFWQVLSCIFCGEDSDFVARDSAAGEGLVPETVEQRRRFLLAHRVALWDVVASCTISGSSDSSMAMRASLQLCSATLSQRSGER